MRAPLLMLPRWHGGWAVVRTLASVPLARPCIARRSR